jgi:LPXTG-motif cell wall-anchored protein
VLLSALALVGFGPTGAAYADKPASPPGQANQSATQHRTSGNAGTSGEATSPQPRSKADRNGTGANQPGAYDSTRDGSPSLNGNGGGKATGKPCAGCVGKADNKNPPGQAPDGSDDNAGYECDRNNGIGKTNPAHTGCTVTQPPTNPEEPTDPEEPTNPEEPEGPCVDNPGTPEDECGEVLPPEGPEGPCVDNPGTPEDECGEVLPPGEPINPPGAEAGPKSPAQTVAAGQPGNVTAAQVAHSTRGLPQTGASSGALMTALAGLLLLGAGIGLTRLQRVRVRA